MSPNSGFWVVPAAAAFAGSAGTMIAVLAVVITSLWGAVCVHLMRRDAPVRQRRATSWIDQSPVLASGVGLLLHVWGPAPSWTADVLTLAGPLLAFSGAALFAGSVVHPHNLSVRHGEHALRRWGWLTVVRVGYYLVLAAAGDVEPAGRGGRPQRVQRPELPTGPARRALRVPLGARGRGGALGMGAHAVRPRAGGADPLRGAAHGRPVPAGGARHERRQARVEALGDAAAKSFSCRPSTGAIAGCGS